MQVIIHCGAHGTEEDRLLKTLLRNRATFANNATVVPGPGRYRALLRKCLEALEQGAFAPETNDALWDAILDEETAERVVLSNVNFWGSRRQALKDNVLYPAAEHRIALTQNLFPDDDLHIHLALRNPAAFIPTLLRDAAPERAHELRHGCDPRQTRWSDLLIRLRNSAPTVPITVWCYEDLPFIWASILRHIGGLPEGTRLQGGLDVLASVMSREGMRRLRAYLKIHDTISEPHKRRVYAAFLDKYAEDDALEEELDVPEWSEALIEEATQRYEDDLQFISTLDGVTLIAP
ncbi:hypothetical protein [Epibacterium ulvae]|uniref:hypothetical protein n=1 Tax=Epibacterium ulvae TaxID=1156985 RepID=UPI00249075A2|nr:hypothetical protein [Epibacterium ulvae]